jgi:isoaspartyl peptidase/L-asparaginase-like protein (Ntn-hydrolase superfamily)
VFNTEGHNELESSIMLSKPPISHPSIPESRRGFALALLTRSKNPIQLARALYLSLSLAPHATLSGTTAEDIGVSLGQGLVDPSYYFTLNRWREHRRGLGLPDRPYPPHTYPDDKEGDDMLLDQLPTGTVGAVALDSRGCIACATSTGGRTNKLPGRVGTS